MADDDRSDPTAEPLEGSDRITTAMGDRADTLKPKRSVPPRSDELAVGCELTPNLRLVRPLGEGAMGSVWVAEHLGLETEVAVKFISQDLSKKGQPEVAQRFAREAKAGARIKSPHVVEVHDFGELADGRPYLVMELLDGMSLRDYLKVQGSLGLTDVARTLEQVGKALDEAHRLNIVHRDIKPDNLFLLEGEALFVKVLDFGIAKETNLSAEAVTTTGMLLGTPHYMSPEHLQTVHPTSPAGDRWALAVTAYELLTGQRPFRGLTLATLIISITNIDYLPISDVLELPDGQGEALDRWFAMAFHQDPEARFESCREAAYAFGHAVGVAFSDSVPPATSVVRPPRRHSVDPHADTMMPPKNAGSKLKIGVAVGAVVAVLLVAGYRATQGDSQTELHTAESLVTAGWQAPRPKPFHRLTVPAGQVEPDGQWLQKFELEFLEEASAKPYLEAQRACRAQGRFLCTDIQWQRACQADEQLATLPTWTLDAVQGGVVIRGNGDCEKRAVVSGAEAEPGRHGLCCDRAVAIMSDRTNLEWRTATSNHLLKYEAALNQNDARTLSKLVVDPITVNGEQVSRGDYVKGIVAESNQHPNHWVAYETCTITTAESGWLASCRVIQQRDGLVAHLRQQTTRRGANGALATFAQRTAYRDFSKP